MDKATDSECYKKKGRGYVVIFNNTTFARQKTRRGSDKDADDIRDTFVKFNHKVRVFNDCTAEEIRRQLAALQTDRYSKYSSLFVFFLTHGYHSGIYGTDEECICIRDLQSYLTSESCPSFCGKPKVLILPACRMDGGQDGSSNMPIEKDFLLAYSTQVNALAYRHIEEGSYYIQCLLKVIRENADKEDFVSMLAMVTQHMENAPLYHLPEYRSCLRGKIFFKRKTQSLLAIQQAQHVSTGCLVTASSLPSGGIIVPGLSHKRNIPKHLKLHKAVSVVNVVTREEVSASESSSSDDDGIDFDVNFEVEPRSYPHIMDSDEWESLNYNSVMSQQLKREEEKTMAEDFSANLEVHSLVSTEDQEWFSPEEYNSMLIQELEQNHENRKGLTKYDSTKAETKIPNNTNQEDQLQSHKELTSSPVLHPNITDLQKQLSLNEFSFEAIQRLEREEREEQSIKDGDSHEDKKESIEKEEERPNNSVVTTEEQQDQEDNDDYLVIELTCTSIREEEEEWVDLSLTIQPTSL